MPSTFANPDEWYKFNLEHAISKDDGDAGTRLVYTYDTVLKGFVAVLSPEEARRLSGVHGVVGVHKDRVRNLHTTRTPDFLGLSSATALMVESNGGENVIIGLVDSGIWPKSLSFHDEGLPPIGPRWRGKCETGERFNASCCNNKLIGARRFDSGITAHGYDEVRDFKSPRDLLGHGTHTASTAAGSEVRDASFCGYANGTAKGMAPRARIAMYKLCSSSVGCSDADILKAVETAVEDGVDILSLSLGPNEFNPYYNDVIEIGTFAAVRNGIFVACSAGNDGPDKSSVSNAAPWMTTVGASSVDRRFYARIILDNGEILIGESLYPKRLLNNHIMASLFQGNQCGTLLPEVEGKIVVCEEDALVYSNSSLPVGLVIINPKEQGETSLDDIYHVPYVTIQYKDGEKLRTYIKKTVRPMARLELSHETIGQNRAPIVAFYSSRGPNYWIPEILKPDLIAPGSTILAAWPGEAPDTWPEGVNFALQSGTSMSCPHVAEVAALLRGAHPTWSPAMIRSAMMTTAAQLDNTYRVIIKDDGATKATPFDMGAGHLMPQMAMDPGLVYDVDVQDYVDLLCALNYTGDQLRVFDPSFKCSASVLEGGPAGFNYPSFIVVFNNMTHVRVLKRTVKKVSDMPKETYHARIVNPRPEKVTVTVEPETLVFDRVSQTQTYRTHFESKAAAHPGDMEFGYVVWESDVHIVKSTVVFMWT